jgi:hypothetical protein
MRDLCIERQNGAIIDGAFLANPGSISGSSSHASPLAPRCATYHVVEISSLRLIAVGGDSVGFAQLGLR